jgi:hypothetical protein
MPLQIANYRGGKGFIDAGIRAFTYADYTHTAVRFTENLPVLGGSIQPGEVIEAWLGGVRRVASLSAQHAHGQLLDLMEFEEPLTENQERMAATFLWQNIGKGYDWLNVLRFVPLVRMAIPTPAPRIWDRKHVYCTELVVEMCSHIGRPLFRPDSVKAWQVAPGDVPRCQQLKLVKSVSI